MIERRLFYELTWQSLHFEIFVFPIPIRSTTELKYLRCIYIISDLDKH